MICSDRTIKGGFAIIGVIENSRNEMRMLFIPFLYPVTEFQDVPREK